MNDRQRLEAIVSVVCKYLPPDGISKDQALNEIIGLVDPLPPQRTWVDLTQQEIDELDEQSPSLYDFVQNLMSKLKEKNT